MLAMRMTIRLSLLSMAFLSLLSAQAETIVFAEGAAVGNIATAYQIFKTQNGKEPQSWPEIETIFDRPLNEAHKAVQPTIRYAFLAQPCPLPDSDSRIVILSRSPAHDQYRMRGFFGPVRGSLPSSLKRYAVVVSDDGEVRSMSFPEDKIQTMFADAGIPLPAPDPLGPRSYESANQFALYIWIVAVSVGGFLIMKFVLLPFLKRAISWQPPAVGTNRTEQ